MNASELESTAIQKRCTFGKDAPAAPMSTWKSNISSLALTGVPAYPWTSRSFGEPRNHGSTSEPACAASTATPRFATGVSIFVT